MSLSAAPSTIRRSSPLRIVRPRSRPGRPEAQVDLACLFLRGWSEMSPWATLQIGTDKRACRLEFGSLPKPSAFDTYASGTLRASRQRKDSRNRSRVLATVSLNVLHRLAHGLTPSTNPRCQCEERGRSGYMGTQASDGRCRAGLTYLYERELHM